MGSLCSCLDLPRGFFACGKYSRALAYFAPLQTEENEELSVVQMKYFMQRCLFIVSCISRWFLAPLTLLNATWDSALISCGANYALKWTQVAIRIVYKVFFPLPGFRCKLMLICPFKLCMTLCVCHCDSRVRGIEDQKKNIGFSIAQSK